MFLSPQSPAQTAQYPLLNNGTLVMDSTPHLGQRNIDLQQQLLMEWSTMVNNGQLETVTLPHWNAWKFVLLENQTLVLTEDVRKFQRNRPNGRACLNVPKIIAFSVLCQVTAAPAYAQFSVQRTSSILKSRSLAIGLTVEHCSAVVSSSLLNSRALQSY